MKTIIKNILLILCTVYQPIGLAAQVVQLDAVKQVPSLDENNMRMIASAIWFLYVDAMKDPVKYTNQGAANDTIFAFKDTDIKDRHEKLFPVTGKLYTACDHDDLALNDRLLFPLVFDTSGTLVVPEKLFVLSHRLEMKNGEQLIQGSWAFELILTDSIKAVLDSVKLERPVLSRFASASGLYDQVSVTIPFNLTHLESKITIQSSLEVDRKNFNFYSRERGLVYENDTNLIKVILEFMEYKLLQYKKGHFTFEILRTASGLQLDLNIRRHNVWTSQQTKSDYVCNYKIENFEGKGIKRRYYRKVRKNIEIKLNHPVRHWPALAH